MRVDARFRLGVASFVAVSLLGAPEAQALRLEVEVGGAFSHFESNLVATSNASNTAFTFGAKLDFNGEGPFSFEPGLQYVPKGFTQTSLFTQSSYYLNAPLLLKARLPVPVVTPFVAAGPELGYAVGQSSQIPALAINTKKFDFGAHLSGGIEFSPIPFVLMYLRAAYSLGLINIAESSTADVKTRALLTTLGVNISL